MKRILFGLGMLFLAGAALAQPVPSLFVPLQPCRMYDSRPIGRFTAGSTHYFAVRETCNVPATASAVALTAVAFNPSANGHVKIFESNGAQPDASSFNFRGVSGGDSSYVTSLLCYPELECAGVDLAVYVYQETDIILDVVGYYVPFDDLELATSAVSGEVIDIQEAQPSGPGQSSFDLLLDNGLHVSCEPGHIDTDICAGVKVGDLVTTTGNPENFFGTVHVYAHDYLGIQ